MGTKDWTLWHPNLSTRTQIFLPNGDVQQTPGFLMTTTYRPMLSSDGNWRLQNLQIWKAYCQPSPQKLVLKYLGNQAAKLRLNPLLMIVTIPKLMQGRQKIQDSFSSQVRRMTTLILTLQPRKLI